MFFADIVSGQGGSNTPPSVALTNPPSGIFLTYPSVIRLKAVASDTDGTIVEVAFYDRTNLLGTLSQPPYNFFLTNWFGYSYYIFTATATDDGGESSTSAPVNVTVTQDIWAPQVTITQPTEGEIFLIPGFFTITAIVNNDDGSENPVQFYSGTNLIGTADTPLYSIPVINPPFIANYYSLNVTNLSIGQHTLTAQYRDNLGNRGTSQQVRVMLTPLLLGGASMTPASHFRFTVEGLSSGKNFEIQASSNLISWSSIATNFASSNIMDFIENTSTNASVRFYRALQNLP